MPTPETHLLERARDGDERAFAELTEPYRRELQLHCYRIVGSLDDAEDLVQETLVAAWRGLARFEGRASPRTWLHRIATNCSLDALRARDRRPREVAAMAGAPPPTRTSDPVWLQPYPDLMLSGIPDEAPGPDARYEAKEAVGLAFVAGLQRLPAQQRAVLVLRDVLGYRAAEAADMLDTTEVAVNGLLSRARGALQARRPAPPERTALPDAPGDRKVLERFARAVADGDAPALAELLTDDALLTMPPQPLVYEGPAAIARFLAARWAALGVPFHPVRTGANGQPAFALYLPSPPDRVARAYGLVVLATGPGGITSITYFADPALFPAFGLPATTPTSG